MIHLPRHYTKSWNEMPYLNVMYGLNANHEIHDLNEIRDLYGFEYMTSNYEIHVNYANDVNRALHMHP